MLDKIILSGIKLILAGFFVLGLVLFYGLQMEMVKQITNLLIF